MIQKLFIAFNLFQSILILLLQCLNLQSDEAVQAHFQDGRGLALGKAEFFRAALTGLGLKSDAFGDAHGQAVLYLFLAAAAPEDLDNQVDAAAGPDQSLLDFLFFHLFGQQALIFPGVEIKLKIHMALDDFLQPQGLRPAVGHRQHVDAEGILQPGLLVEQVSKLFRIRPLFQFQDNADAFLGGLVGDVHDVRSLFALHQFRHII